MEDFLENARNEFLYQQLRNSLAISANQEGAFGIRSQNRHFQAATGGASGGCFPRSWLATVYPDFIGLASLLGVQFEGAAAFCANMVEAALRLARIDDVGAVALRATHNVFEGGETHADILCEEGHATQ
jgi:hypothetical protein